MAGRRDEEVGSLVHRISQTLEYLISQASLLNTHALTSRGTLNNLNSHSTSLKIFAHPSWSLYAYPVGHRHHSPAARSFRTWHRRRTSVPNLVSPLFIRSQPAPILGRCPDTAIHTKFELAAL